mgnify:CR=1 FL=1
MTVPRSGLELEGPGRVVLVRPIVVRDREPERDDEGPIEVRDPERDDEGPSRKELRDESRENDGLVFMEVRGEREDSTDLPRDGADLKLLREREDEAPDLEERDLPEDPSLRVSPENAVMETRQKIAIKPIMPVLEYFMIFSLLMTDLVLQAVNK